MGMGDFSESGGEWSLGWASSAGLNWTEAPRKGCPLPESGFQPMTANLHNDSRNPLFAALNRKLSR